MPVSLSPISLDRHTDRSSSLSMLDSVCPHILITIVWLPFPMNAPTYAVTNAVPPTSVRSRTPIHFSWSQTRGRNTIYEPRTIFIQPSLHHIPTSLVARSWLLDPRRTRAYPLIHRPTIIPLPILLKAIPPPQPLSALAAPLPTPLLQRVHTRVFPFPLIRASPILYFPPSPLFFAAHNGR